MRIRWHGHACFEVSDELTIVIDPHDGRSLGIKPPSVRADIVLVTHEHFDHNAVKSVLKPTTRIVKGPGRHQRHEIVFVGIPSCHDDVKGASRGENTIFRFTYGGITFCHLGDLGEELDDVRLRRIGRVDILFIPTGGRFTIDAEGAWSLAERINPRVVVPMHYRIGGLNLPLDPLDVFLRHAENVVRVGNEIDIMGDELPIELETWIFSM